jgi:hypothetical protein
MNINEFIFEKIKTIEQFEQYWNLMIEENPKSFPDELNEGDWDDQFALFELTYKKEL